MCPEILIVGIGTTSPGALLDVAGSVKFSTSAGGSFAFGNGATSGAFNSVALGDSTTASGSGAIAISYSTTASGSRSTVTGSQSVASGQWSSALGHSVVVGDYTPNDGAGDFSVAIGAGNTPARAVTGTGSVGIFLGGDTGSTLSASNTMAIMGGNVGIGTTAPRAALDVSGGAFVTAPAISASSTVNFSSGNIQYTTSSCGAFQFNNLKDGGTYTFVVKGATSATCSFTAYSDAGSTPLTVHMPPDHGATTASKFTLYNMIVVGGDVLVAWTPGY